MSEYKATVRWDRGGVPFTDNRYSRAHVWRFDGGAEVPASSSPSVVPVPLSDPRGVDPEEALVASLSSCHMLWFLAIAAKKGFVVDSYTDDAVGYLEKNAEGKPAVTRVVLRPRVAFAGDRRPDSTVFEKMHHKAHAECYIANSVKSDVRCEPVAT